MAQAAGTVLMLVKDSNCIPSFHRWWRDLFAREDVAQAGYRGPLGAPGVCRGAGTLRGIGLGLWV